jgi:hypothetical protein
VTSQRPTPTSGVVGNIPQCDEAVVYVVYPDNGASSTQTTAIKKQLESFVDPSEIEEVDLSGYGVLFWTLKLTASQASKIKTFSNVWVDTVSLYCYLLIRLFLI